MDAVSMYTNIDTNHALSVINTFLRGEWSFFCLQSSLNINAIMSALSIVMKNNIFRFGDTHWQQQSGTAMGTPPAPTYATLYYAIHERTIIPKFSSLLFYCRYIDDGLGIWVPPPPSAQSNQPLLSSEEITDLRSWIAFQAAVNNFGKLRWTFSDRSTTIDYLDITLSLNASTIETNLYEKALNLYLYLPRHSAHPPGMLNGLIAGAILRIVSLCTIRSTALGHIYQFYTRLCRRGFQDYFLRPIFNRHLARAFATSSRPSAPATIASSDQVTPSLYFHVPYHPGNPPSAQLHKMYNTLVRLPAGNKPLDEMNNGLRVPFGDHRLVIAHHRPRNLGNYLAPRRLLTSPDTPVSRFLPVDIRGSSSPLRRATPRLNPSPPRAFESCDV